jgi:serine/threonine protein phosphatase PrpC
MQGTFLFNSGWRKSMEDSVIFKEIVDGVYIFGVFDGHGGPEVARYVADNLPIFLKEDSFFKSKNYSKSLSSVFRKIDDNLQSVKGEEDLLIISKRLGVTHPQK